MNTPNMIPADYESCKAEVQRFIRESSGRLILHISDTDTCLYPFARALLQEIHPALTIHTGDMADEYKAGRIPAHVEGYMRVVPELLDMMEDNSGEVWIVPGNNDVMSIVEGRKKIKICLNGTRTSAFGVRMDLDHVAIPAAFGVDFAIYGHGPTDDLRYPLDDMPGEAVYLNGNYFWTLIDAGTKRFLRIPSRKPATVMRLLIVRHGQTRPSEYINNDADLPKADPPITDVGFRQARLTAAEIVRMRFQGRILCSPFTRTLQSAQPIAQAIGQPIHLAYEFREIVKTPESMIGFRGKDVEELKREFPEISPEETLPYPWWKEEAETFEDVKERVRSLIDRTLAEGENTLLVGHGASVSAAVGIMLEKCGLEFNNYMPLPSGGNSTISEFRISNGKIRPVRVLSVSHLPATMITSNYRYALNPIEKK